MEIAAAGGHHIILVGPPGAGKTMLAKRLPSILPPMTLKEALETTKIHGVAGKLKEVGLMNQRPFRSPHHTISNLAFAGVCVKYKSKCKITLVSAKITEVYVNAKKNKM
jgi:magnesium chelatase family protein